MASTGHLLLLLMSSLFLLCSLGVPQPSSLQKHHSVQKRDVTTFITVTKYVITALDALPKIINKFKQVVLGDRSETQKILFDIKESFQTLNRNFDNQLITTKWHTWASGPYQKAEVNIKIAWKNIINAFDMCKDPCKKEYYEDVFKKQYEHLVHALASLHILLTTNEDTFITNFQTLFSDHFRCHEKDIMQFTKLISTLMSMGNAVSLFNNKLHEVDKTDDVAQMTFEIDAVVRKIYINCLSNPNEYIEKDVFDLIVENKDRQKLAKDIKDTLDKIYDRYDWVVVAFLTRHSDLKKIYNKFLNKHYLSGFMAVTKGEVSVAVAKQVKGTHEKASLVKNAIKRCVSDTTPCESLIEKLEICDGIAPWTPLKSTYTAVHAYPDKSHDSVEGEEEVLLDEDQPTVSHIYTGKCVKYKVNKNGHFRVMIKSDDDIKDLPLCEHEKCGKPENGKCVSLRNILEEACECNKGYSGSTCGISLEEFKKTLREEEPKQK